MLPELLKQTGCDLAFTMVEIGALPLGSEPEPFHALLKPWPRSRVVAFEVDEAECARWNASAPPGLRYYPTALAKDTGIRTFYETMHPMCGSLYPPDERYADLFHNLDVMRLKQIGTLATTSLDAFTKSQSIGPVDFIKMDIQGAELEVLLGGSETLRDVLMVVCEVEFVPIYKNQPLFGDVDALLRSQGFSFHKFLGLAGRTARPLVFNNNPNLPVQHLWADAVFIRDPFQLDSLSPEQLQKLATLLDLYASQDLAQVLLNVCDQRMGTTLGAAYLNSLLPAPPTATPTPEPASRILPMVDGVRIVVPDSLDLISNYVLQEQGDWFEDEIKFLRRLLRPGQRIIDVGANYGVYTLSMAHTVGQEGRIWAFEPASSTAQLLSESIRLNDFSQVVLIKSALSSTVGTARLQLNDNSELNALVRGGDEPQHSEEVPLTTLDACLTPLGWTDLAFMKIDAEGEESAILRGGRNFFSTLSPLVQYEVKAGADLHLELASEFMALGYDSYRLVPGLDLLVPFERQESADGYLLNLFCCKPDRAALLSAEGFLVRHEDLRPSDSEYASTPWPSLLQDLPYGRLLMNGWRETLGASPEPCLEAALDAFAASRNAGLPPADRYRCLSQSFDLLVDLCDTRPNGPRLASLARVAREIGARSQAVDALKRLLGLVAQGPLLGVREPFLLPESRFDTLAPGVSLEDWFRAAALEAFERLSAFSSFYTRDRALPRLQAIHSLGFGQGEMERRLHLVRQRFSIEEPPASPTQCNPFPAYVDSTETPYGRLLFPVNDAPSARSVQAYGQYLEEELALCRQFVGQGAVVLEIGSGFGAQTVPLAIRVGEGGAVVAFEPDPGLQTLLSANLLINNIPNAIPYALALGSEEGIWPRGFQAAEETEQAEAIPVSRLDDFQLERVDFIKMNVAEGATGILEGAEATLRRCRPLLYLRGGNSPSAAMTVQRLLNLDYRLWAHPAALFTPGNPKGQRLNLFPGAISHNLLAIPKELPPIQGLRPILSHGDIDPD